MTGLTALGLLAALFVTGCWMNTYSGTVHSMPPESKQAPQYAPSSRFTVNEGAADRYDPNSLDMDAAVEAFREFLFDW